MSHTTVKEWEASSVRDIMEQLSMSETEARAWRAAFMRKYFANREQIYSFLKAHNPKVAELEDSGDYRNRIQQVSSEMQIPETTATALVITGELLSEGALKLLRKQRHLRKKKSTPQDIQEMLGVSVPIPQDVWDALGMDDA